MNGLTMFLSHLGVNPSMSPMKKASYEVSLKRKRQIAEKTYEFIFEKPKNFQFKAGQHIRMALINPSQTDTKGNSRFMTLATTPKDKDLIIAMRMTDSAFKRVLGNMKIGKKVLIQILLGVPHGAFALHNDTSKPAVFLTGGIGIVPAYAMIKDATERKLPHKLFLFYSNRRPEDAAYLKELKILEKKNPKFKLIATVTQAKKTWNEENRIIDRSMVKKYVGDLNSPIYYIAGLTEMVNAMKALLKDLKVNDANIRAEDFSASKMSSMNGAVGKTKKYLFIIAIILMVLLGFMAHAGAVASIFNTNSLKNLSFLTILLIFTVVIFKLFLVLKFKKKLSLSSSHQPNRQ